MSVEQIEGTAVLGGVPGMEIFSDEPRAPEPLPLAAWTRNVRPSIIAEMLGLMSRPGVISFALGLPSPDMFPVDAYLESAGRVLQDRTSLQYRPPYAQLKRQIVKVMEERGVECDESQVFLTTAAQQGLALLARLLLNPGGQVICERLVYSGFQQVLEPYQPRILTVDTDPRTGIDVDQVEAHLEAGARPAFIYVITDGHNPVGVSVSPEKRVRLVDLARHYGVPIVEDDAYGLLNYDRPVLPMRALEERWVLYVGSFSKVMAPGFRVGWLVVPRDLVQTLGCAKDASDIDTSTFTQRLVSDYIASGHFERHMPVVREAYRTRRDVMLNALRREFPEGARWTVPSNGALIWLELPRSVDTTKLLRVALESESVAYVPGQAFAIDGSQAGSNGMRLNFSHASPADIDEGITRLARAARAVMG
jgi:2-aminoadipate transaminase